MKRVFRFALHLALFGLTLAARAALVQAGGAKGATVLVMIGYSDHHVDWSDKLGIGSYDYVPSVSERSEREIISELEADGFRFVGESAEGGKRFVDPHSGSRVLLMNANVRCPGEPPLAPRYKRTYRGECVQQAERSLALASFVREHLFSFDGFVYVGHSRVGRGFSFGNLNEESTTVNPEALARSFIGRSRLKFVYMASCKSLEYYGSSFSSIWRNPSPVFFGVQDTRMWSGELVPSVVRILRSLRGSEDAGYSAPSLERMADSLPSFIKIAR